MKHLFKKGYIPWNKGMRLSEKTRRKISEAGKGRHHSEETKRKLSKTNKVSIKKLWQNPEYRKHMIEVHRGKHLSEETKRKQSEALKGEKSYLWKGGVSFEPYSIDWTETLRRAIRERDNYICQICSQYGDNVHHKDYNKKNCCPDNLITLCRGCNSKVNFNREHWIRYFRESNKMIHY